MNPKINKKHIRQINQLLANNIGNSSESLAYAMYCIFGFDITLDILNGKYGKIPIVEKLSSLLGHISLEDISFIDNGKYQEPVLKRDFLNMFLGENYKDQNSIFYRYLTDNLSYNEHIKNFGNIFENWDAIKREFQRAKMNLNLETKLDAMNALKTLTLLQSRKEAYDIDKEFFSSEVIYHVVYQDRFTPDRKKAIEVAKELFYQQRASTINKKFPFVQLKTEQSTISFFHPKDTQALLSGYISDCCFKPTRQSK